MKLEGMELEDLDFHKIGSWPKKIRILLCVIVGGVTLLLGYFLDTQDLYYEYINQKNERVILQDSYENFYDQASHLEKYKKQVAEIEKTLEGLIRQLPKTSEEAGLLDDLSRQAISSGLTFQSFKPFPEERKTFYEVNPIELSLQGSYHNFGEFVSNIVSMPRMVTLHDFSIKTKEQNYKRLNITAVVKTYKLAQNDKETARKKEEKLEKEDQENTEEITESNSHVELYN